jgi:Ca2+-binding RTX toxin-like protein
LATLNVGAGQQYTTIAAAVAASRDGDTIAVQAGTYTNDFATINTKITIIGVGGMANLVATQPPPNGKGIFVTNTDVRIENLSFSGAKVADGNGAGIRYQDGHLTIVNSQFHHNENGLLSNASPTGKITIIGSEFSHNGKGDGQTHNLYVSAIDTLTITDSYFHDASVGHQIKSRAQNTIVIDSRIYDGAAGGGTGSYSIDIPNGGKAVITGNVIQQSASSQNPAILHFGGEGTAYAGSSLQVSDNTVLNQLTSPSTRLLLNQTSVTATIADNAVFGLTSGQIATGPATVSGITYLPAAPVLDTTPPWQSGPTLPTLPTLTVTLDDTTPTEGALLTGAAVPSKALGGASLTYQWQSLEAGAWKDVAGARGVTFTPGAGEAGEQLRLKVTLADGTRSEVTYSTATEVTGRQYSGGATNDNPALTAGADIARGNGGNDALRGLGGHDTLDGGAGNDTLDGGGGDDRMLGGAGNDFYVVDSLGDAVVETQAGGIDTVTTALPTYRLAPNAEILIGTRAGAQTLTGNALANTITGGTGNDTLHGAEGDDWLSGGEGTDSLFGGVGNDTLDGGNGPDRLTGGPGDDRYILGAGDVVTEAPGGGHDTVEAGFGTSFTMPANTEVLLLTGTGALSGVGNALDNLVIGNAAANVLHGSDGNDTLRGEGGNDVLHGGAGTDVLVGGAGADQFRFMQADHSPVAAPDQILDFVAGQDRIDLRWMDANPALAGDQAFAYVAGFTDDAGQVTVTSLGGGRHRVLGDINGDGGADFAIDVASAAAPSAGWFLL